MVSNFYALVIIFTFSFLASANEPENNLKNSLLKETLKKPLINEKVVIKATDRHHFNLQAPQDCGPEATIVKTARKIQCQFHSQGQKKALVSVCDDDKKYCKQEAVHFQVQGSVSKTPRMKQPPVAETLSMQKAAKDLLMKGFKTLSVQQARSQKIGKEGALILVSTDWCPPCNMVKEFLLPTQEFQSAVKGLDLIYVDGDGPFMTQWREQIGTFFYPSFVLVDSDLNPVAIRSGYMKTSDFRHWLSSGRKNLDDSLKQLQARIDARISGSFLQRLRDFFVSADSKSSDLSRWIQHLAHVAQYDAQANYIGKTEPQKYQMESLLAQFSNVWFGSLSSELSTEEREKTKKEIAKKILNDDFPITNKNKVHWMFTSLIEQYCPLGEDIAPKEKPIVSKERCLSLLRKLRDKKIARKKALWKELTEAEKTITEAQMAKSEAKLSKLEGQVEQTKKFKQLCRNLWQKTKIYSPLKEKSRAARLEELYCIDKSHLADSKALIQSLIQDFPYEYTFHTRLAGILLKEKKLAEALRANKKALIYAYGDSWAAALTQRVDILKAMGKRKEALNFLEKNMGEISLDQKGNKNWFMNKVRAQLKELQNEKKTL